MPIDSQSDKLKSSPVFGDSALLKVSALKANDSRITNANKILVNRFLFTPPIVYLSKVFSVLKYILNYTAQMLSTLSSFCKAEVN